MLQSKYEKTKLVIIVVILTLIGAGIGVYIAVCIAPKNKGNASQRQEQKITSSPNFTKSSSGNSSSSSKSNKDPQPKQSTPNQQEKKPEKPQPSQKEQRIDLVRPKHNPAPQPPANPAAPPKNNQRPAPQPQQPGNSQQPAPNPQPNPTPNPQPQPADQDKKYDIGPPDALEILELINYARSKENLKPLKMYEPLNRTAQWMANDMKENNYFSHYKPGTTIPHGLLKARSVCNAPAENLVQTSPPDLHTSRVAFNAWMQSPPHRQSIMSSAYTLTGFGIAGNKIVEHFC